MKIHYNEYKHSFASYVLSLNDFKIYIKSKQILKEHYYSDEDIPPLETRVEKGINLLRYIDLEKIKISYQKLQSLGYKIINAIDEYTGERYFRIVPKSEGYSDLGEIPSKHSILYDVQEQKLKLLGHKCYKFSEKIERPKPEKENSFIDLNDLLPDFMKESSFVIPDQDLPIGVTDTGEIACIRRRQDTVRIIISGSTGFGKSTLFHRLQDLLFWKWHVFQIDINDIKRDTRGYCLKGDSFSKPIKDFGETPLPLPTIYLHLNTKKLTDEMMIHPGEVGFRISLPFKELLDDYDSFNAYSERNWNLGGSTIIFKNIKDELAKLKSLEEINERLDKYTKHEVPKNSREKIKRILRDIWEQKILDKTSKIPAKWTLEFSGQRKTYYPWTACILAGLVPVLVTEHIKNEKYFPIFLRFVLKDLFEQQKRDILFRDKELYVTGDEMPNIFRNKITRDLIDEAIAEGRTDRIGHIYVVQSYTDIFPSIQTNISHTFVFRTAQKDIKQTLSKNFELSKEEISLISKLKRHQCMAFGEFVLYDNEGNVRETDEPLIIQTFRPLSRHLAPRKVF